MRQKKKSAGAIQDRRAFSRVYYQHELTLQANNGKIYAGAFNDISLKGMLFNAEQLPPKDSVVSGTLVLGSIALNIKGIVLDCHAERGAAIRFQEMDVESFSHLRRLVALNMGDSDIIDEEFFANL